MGVTCVKCVLLGTGCVNPGVGNGLYQGMNTVLESVGEEAGCLKLF